MKHENLCSFGMIVLIALISLCFSSPLVIAADCDCYWSEPYDYINETYCSANCNANCAAVGCWDVDDYYDCAIGGICGGTPAKDCYCYVCPYLKRCNIVDMCGYGGDPCNASYTYALCNGTGSCEGSYEADNTSDTGCNGNACGNWIDFCEVPSMCDSKQHKKYCQNGECSGQWHETIQESDAGSCEGNICSNINVCFGDTYYDGKKCSATEGDCSDYYGDIGCCQHSKCNSSEYCRSDHNCTPLSACHERDGINYGQKAVSAKDGYNCNDDCTYCDSGTCTDRDDGDETECCHDATGIACARCESGNCTNYCQNTDADCGCGFGSCENVSQRDTYYGNAFCQSNEIYKEYRTFYCQADACGSHYEYNSQNIAQGQNIDSGDVEITNNCQLTNKNYIIDGDLYIFSNAILSLIGTTNIEFIGSPRYIYSYSNSSIFIYNTAGFNKI